MTASHKTAATAPSADRFERDRGGVAPDLVADAHPERLRACLGERVSAATVHRLQQSRRLRPRLQALLVRHFGESAGPSPEPAGGALEEGHPAASILDHPDLLEATRLAGALWHARALRLLVSGGAVGELVSRIGRRAHAFGLRNVAHAVEAAPTAADPIALASAIERDGLLCLGAGFAAACPALRLRLLTRLAPGTPAEAAHFDDIHVRNAPAVLARVAAELGEPPHGA
jgi:hypothetical protein